MGKSYYIPGVGHFTDGEGSKNYYIPGAGHFTEAGAAAIVSELSSGSFVLTGNNLDTSITRTSLIESGLFVLTGSNIQLLYDQLISLESGAFILTGSSVSTGAPTASIIDIQLVHSVANKFEFDNTTVDIYLERVTND